MSKILTTLILLFGCYFLSGQRDNLSEQELTVIKSYQFDLTESRPILSDISLHLPKLQLKPSEFQVDLLPVKLEDVTFSIKPLAHIPSESKFYQGFASAAFGNLQFLDIQASYRHQVPNYFMYGIDVDYTNLSDQNVLSKERNDKKAAGFLRYYLKPTFWFEYETAYKFTKQGVFGFNEDNPSGSTGGEIKEENYRQSKHQISLFKRLKKIKTDIRIQNSLLSAKNTRMNLGENIVHNELFTTTNISPAWSINTSSDHKRQISTINDSDNKFLWNSRVNLTFANQKIGFKLEGLFSLGDQTKALPVAEFFIKGKAHSLTGFYHNSLDFNSFYDNQDEINLIYISSYETSISRTNSYGLEYEFKIKGAHGLNLNASWIDKTDDQIWVNNSQDYQYFSFELLDYSYYNFGIGYHINLLENLEFNQNVDYNLLQDLASIDIPHFQVYNVRSSLSYIFKRIQLKLDYLLGDQVAFTQSIENYAKESSFQHDIRFEVKYHISDAVQVSLNGMDLLNNRFEAYAGYKDFGRRGNLSIMAKF